MKRLTASKSVRICWRLVLLVFIIIVATFAAAQTLAKRPSPAKSEAASGQTQENPDAVSNNNALAEPSGENSIIAFRSRTPVQSESNAIPRSPINDLIREAIDRMPQGGDYRASSRLTHPENISQIRELANDEYLASMLIRSSTPEEMDRMVGIAGDRR
jgi:hypothetical protein